MSKRQRTAHLYTKRYDFFFGEGSLLIEAFVHGLAQIHGLTARTLGPLGFSPLVPEGTQATPAARNRVKAAATSAEISTRCRFIAWMLQAGKTSAAPFPS